MLQDRAPSRRSPAGLLQGRAFATAIAETPSTIEPVRVVTISRAWAMPPCYELGCRPHAGSKRRSRRRGLPPISAAVERAASEPGVCYRLWDEPQTAGLRAGEPPGDSRGRISPALVLDLARWGVTDPAALGFLDPPPAPALAEAEALLRATRRPRRR